jgi:hypothetical protein
MATLIFFATFLSLLVLLVRLIIKIISRKSISSTLRIIATFLVSYLLIWCICYFTAKKIVVPFSSDVCFDDWCATIEQTEIADSIGSQKPTGKFVILSIRMTNKARGIEQAPSEPRVHIYDDAGHIWSLSVSGQQALEKQIGKQIPLTQRLTLNQSLQTKLVFDIPNNVKYLKAIIEEGPFITKLLFREDEKVFEIK